MKKIFLVVLLCSIGISDYACLNEFITRSDGHSTESGPLMGHFYRGFDTDFSQKLVDSYDLSKKDSIPYEELSDVSIHLAKLARYEESLTLLLWLYERHSEDYRVNANLGTLYELNGNNDSAYYFIEKSITLNPDSHDGTEWVHLSILRAKIKMENNPDWIYANKVINLYYQQALDPDSEITYAIEDSLRGIIYQLEERIPFSPTPDPLVANIFDELGDLLATHFSIGDAYVAYLIADQYDPENRFGAKAKSDEMLFLLKKEKATIPLLAHHFKVTNDFEDIDDEHLPTNTPENPGAEKQTNSGNLPLIIEDGIGYNRLLSAAGGGLLLFVLVYFLVRKKSKK